ncbi:MAG TPA: calcium-binding protein, partial [Sphingomicrobium sp.]
MPFEFSDAQLAQIDAAYRSPTAARPVADAYAIIHGIISGQPDVDSGVVAWFGGAEKVNRGEGVFSDFIRAYTSAQHELRFGSPLNAAQLQSASDSIGQVVIEKILAGHVPPLIGTLASDDAGPTAASFFEGDRAGWSGNILFPALGYNLAYQQNIIEDPADTYDLLASSVAARIAGGAAGGTLFSSFSNFWSAATDVWSTIGTVGTAAELTGEISDFLEEAYNGAFPNALTQPFTSYSVGTKAADNLVTAPGSEVINLGEGNDKVVASTGTDLLDGGKGRDTVYFTAGGAVSVTIDDDPAAKANLVAKVTSGLSVTNLFGFETIVGSDQNDTFIVRKLINGLTVDGGGGTDDAISFMYLNSGVVLGAPDGPAGQNASMKLTGFETIDTTNFADRVDLNIISADIYLHDGDDVLVHAAPGSRVFGGDGDDIFAYSPGVQIADASADDRILLGSKVLTGGLHWKASANPYAWDLTRTLGYGLNKAGELVIHVKSMFGDINDMFVADWHGGPGASENIAGVYLADVEMGVYRLLEDWPAHLTILGTWEFFMGAMMKANYGVSFWKDVDPLVLDLDGDGLELTGISLGKLVFDIDGDGYGERTGWVRGDDGILVLDANNDGQIKDVSEMFGGPGQSGFAELATHDGNADGKVNASDAVFANLRVWRDLDQDRQVDEGELLTLTQLGITLLGVMGTPSTATNTTNHINATGTFTRADGSTGTTSDIAFNLDNQNTLFLGDRTVSTAAAALPDLKGYGTLPDLHVAMTLTPSLQGVVSSNLSGLGQLDLVAMRDALTPILTAWANASPVTGRPPLLAHDDVPILVEVVNGVEAVNDFAYRATDATTGQNYWKLASGTSVKDANGAVIARPTLQQVQDDTHLDGTWSSLDGGVIAFFERYMGENLPLDQAPTNPAAAAAGMTEMISGFWNLLNSMAVRAAMQGPLASFFPGLRYDVETDGFEATTARQLIPTFEAVFTQVDALGSSGLARLEAWQPILSIVIGDYHQPDELVNTNGFLFSNIVAAYESVGLDLGIVAVADALGLPADLVRTGTGAVAGGNDADLFYLATGNQTLSGGLGPDTYVVGRNFGQDVINDLEGQSQSHSEDVVRFADVASSQVTARREGLDLVITVNGTSDELRIVNQFDGRLPGLGGGGDLSEETGVDYIVFSDGVTWNDFNIAKAVSRPEAGDQTQVGTATIDVLDGGAGNDSLSGKDDADFYVFGRDYGNDVIFDDISHIYLTEGDTVAFRPGITFEDIIWSRIGSSDDLLIKIRGDSGSLKIVGQFTKTYTGPFGEQFLNMVENFQFADGRLVTWQDVIDIIKATGGTDGNDTIYGYDLEDDLGGGKGDDYLSGGN